MSKSKRYLLSLLLIVVLLSISTSVVFAKELTLLTLSGPGIRNELAMNNRELMVTLEKAGFFDQTALVQPPMNLNLEAGYNITAYLNLDGQVLPYVEMVYYAADQGQPGYVHYTGRLGGESLLPVDEWQILTSNADNTFRGLMNANDITLQPALVTVPSAPAVGPLSAPAIAPVTVQATPLLWVSLAVTLLLAGVALTLKRRAAGQTIS